MFEPKEITLEREPVADPTGSKPDHADVAQQLAAIQQELASLRQEVGGTQQQLAQIQSQLQVLYGLSQYIGSPNIRGFRQWTLLVYLVLSPLRWPIEVLRWGKQLFREPWVTFYWLLFRVVLWRGRIIHFFKRLRRSG